MGRRWVWRAAVAQALGVALLPKCPACFAAYLGILGSAGAALGPPTAGFRWLGAICVGGAVAAIGYRAWGNRRPWAATAVAVAGIALAYAALYPGFPWLAILGVAGVIAAVRVSERPRRPPPVRWVRPCCVPSQSA